MLARRGKQQWMHTRRDAQPSYCGPHLQHTAHSICKKGGWEAWGCAGWWGTAKEDCFQATTVSAVLSMVYIFHIKYLTVRDFCFSFCFVLVHLYFRPYMGEVVLYPGQFCSLGNIQICLKKSLGANEVLWYGIVAGLFLRILQGTVHPLTTENYPVQNVNGAKGEHPYMMSSSLWVVNNALGSPGHPCSSDYKCGLEMAPRRPCLWTHGFISFWREKTMVQL